MPTQLDLAMIGIGFIPILLMVVLIAQVWRQYLGR